MTRLSKKITQNTDNQVQTNNSICPISENELLEYARANIVISVPSIQRKFKVGYHTAIEALSWLITYHKALPLSVTLPIYTT